MRDILTSFLTNNNDMNASSVDYEMSPKQDGSDNDPNSPGQTLDINPNRAGLLDVA